MVIGLGPKIGSMGEYRYDVEPTVPLSEVDLQYPTPSELYGMPFYDRLTESGIRKDGIDYADTSPREAWDGPAIREAYRRFENGEYGSLAFEDFVNMVIEFPVRAEAIEDLPPVVTLTDHNIAIMRASHKSAESDEGSHIGTSHSTYDSGGRFGDKRPGRALDYGWDGDAITRGDATLGAEGAARIRSKLDSDNEITQKLNGNKPNVNATWSRDRAQGPTFYKTIRLLCKLEGNEQALEDYLPLIERHYHYWRRGAGPTPYAPQEEAQLGMEVGDAHLRVVRMADGADGRPRFMYRFFDEGASKGRLYRDEMREADKATFREREKYLGRDMTMAEKVELAENLAASAADGEDFTLNATGGNRYLHQVRTTKMISAKLNAMQHDGAALAATAYYTKARQAEEQGDTYSAADYLQRAHFYEQDMLDLAEGINKYCINNEGFAVNYDYEYKLKMASMSLSGIYVLTAGAVSQTIGNRMLEIMDQRFLKDGGLVMTLYEDSPEQWDAKVWPMIQMNAIDAAVAYGRMDLALKWCKTFLAANDAMYERYRALYEKSHPGIPGEKGEAGEYDCVKNLLMSIGADMALRAKLEWLEAQAVAHKSHRQSVTFAAAAIVMDTSISEWPWPADRFAHSNN